MTEATASFNPEYDPTGIEGGVDTNALPWLGIDGVAGVSVKPMRASVESGTFSIILRLDAGACMRHWVFQSGMDLLVLSGHLLFDDGQQVSSLTPGIWGYLPANSHVTRLEARTSTELLVNCFGPVALLDEHGQVGQLVSSLLIRRIADRAGLALVPSTLAECALPRETATADYHAPLAIARSDAGKLITDPALVGELNHPHFIDCRAVPWVVNPGLPDVGLKVLRVSQETGMVSLIVRHNGVADPHTHIGGADFLVLQGRIGYRAGPPEGYGPGVWFYEPPGARHEATQRVTDEDLIYTANLYGPIVFDAGRGTPVTAVLSWVEYLALAEASGATLVPSNHPADSSLLALAPISDT